MKNKAWLTVISLLFILFATPTPVRSEGIKSGDKIMLSLKIAKAKKEKQKTERYKSIVRQRKLNRSLESSAQ
ncbi:MAG: hypothetical protein FWH25_03450 [Syntrophorhabdaceae bacterium]|nr:hypothetical protein [Syntrophorhabdaceae bacterium]